MTQQAQTPGQRKALDDYDIAVGIMVKWADKQIPAIANSTPETLVDEIGYLQELQKAAEKVENALWQRLSSMQGGGHPVNSKGIPTPENQTGTKFNYTYSEAERSALDQTKAKSVLSELGRLPECMSDTVTLTKKVKRA